MEWRERAVKEQGMQSEAVGKSYNCTHVAAREFSFFGVVGFNWFQIKRGCNDAVCCVV